MEIKTIILFLLITFSYSYSAPLSVYISPYNISSDGRTEQAKAYKRSHKQDKVNDKFHRGNNRKIKRLQ